MSSRAITLLCALALAACGGDGAGSAAPTSAGAAVTGAVRRDTRTVVVFLVDGLRGDVDAEVAPRLVELRDASLRFDDYVTSSTGTNSAIATLLTGLEPVAHGLGSLHDRGRERLSDELDTFVERFDGAGWHTHAVLSATQLRLSGFEQGFDVFEVPALSERAGRSAQASYDLARAELGARLAADEPALVVIQLADLRSPEVPPEAGLHLERFLAPHAQPGSELARALAGAQGDPARALAEAQRLLGRMRGSAAYAALAHAQNAGRLAVLDRGVGAFLDLLDDAGRLDEALVVVVSTKGALLAPPQRGGGPAFLEEVVRVPLWLRLPGASARGSVPGCASSIDLAPTLLGVLGERNASAPGRDLLAVVEDATPLAQRIVRVSDARLERFAVFDSSAHAEHNSVSPEGVMLFARPARALSVDPDIEESSEHAALRAACAALPTFGVQVDSTLPALDVYWRFAEGQAADAAAELANGGVASASGVGPKGQASLSQRGTVRVTGTRRDLPLRLTLRAAGLVEDQVAVGAGLPLPMTFLPRLASADAPDWPEEREAEVSLVHDGGAWARLSVGGAAGRAARALVALYPPDPQRRDALEWSAGPDVQVEFVSGRTDAVWISGTTPFELQLKELPKTQLAFAVRAGAFSASPADIRLDDKSMGAPGVIELYLPDWIDGVTPLLEEPASEFPPPVLLRRTGSSAPRSGRALDRDERFFVRFLGAGE